VLVVFSFIIVGIIVHFLKQMDILKIYTLNMLLPNAFGGTCPITPDSPTAGSSVAVNRPPEPTVTTQACTDIAGTTSYWKWKHCTGGGKSSIRGFCYKVGTTGDPTTADSTV
jgi:hypothetical protein